MSELRRLQNQRYHDKLQAECFSHYGGMNCYVEGCTEHDPEKLELDHLEGGGNIERDSIFHQGHASPGGWHFWLWLKQHGWPGQDKLRVICIRHHDIKHGRLPAETRAQCAPGSDPTRHETYTDSVPF